MEELLLGLLLYGQMILGGTEICFEPQYKPYRRPIAIISYGIDTQYYEYIGSVKVDGELKPLFTLRNEES